MQDLAGYIRILNRRGGQKLSLAKKRPHMLCVLILLALIPIACMTSPEIKSDPDPCTIISIGGKEETVNRWRDTGFIWQKTFYYKLQSGELDTAKAQDTVMYFRTEYDTLEKGMIYPYCKSKF